MKERTKRLLSWAQGIPAGPLEIRLETTYRCNLACLSCFRRGQKYDHRLEVPRARLLDIIRQSADLHTEKWHLTGGGEPLIRFDTTMAIMREIKKLGMVGQITTNGTLFDEPSVKSLVELEFDEVQFSIDGATAQTQDAIRNRPNTFKRNIAGLTLFQKWKQKLRKDHPQIIFSTVISNRNYTQLSDLVKLAHRYGVVNIIAEPVTIHSELTKETALNEGQKNELPHHLEAAQELADRLGVRTNMSRLVDRRYVQKDCITKVICEQVAPASSPSPACSNPEPEPAEPGLPVKPTDEGFFRIPCYEPWLGMWVLPDGLIGPCRVVAGDHRYACDNIKTKDLAEIWYGERFTWFRELMQKNIPADCRRCCANQVLTVKDIQREMMEFRQLSRG